MSRRAFRRAVCFLLMIAVVIAFTLGIGTETAAAAIKTPSQVQWGEATATKTSIKLTWKKTKNTTGYKIYRYNAAGKKWGLIKTITKATTTSYIDKKLKANTTYKYKIRAYKSYKQKQWYNKKTKKWQVKKPAKKNRGKSRNVNKVKYGKYAKQVKTIKTKANVTTPTTPTNPGIPKDYEMYFSGDEFLKAGAELVKDAPKPSSGSMAADGDFATRRLIVKSSKELDVSGLKAQKAIFDGKNIWILQFKNASDARNAMKKLAKDSSVEWVEADKWVDTESDQSTQSFKSWGVKKIEADQFAESLEGKPDEVVVAVVDTGVADHPFLSGRVKPNGFDFIDVDDDPVDEHFHGTHVAGTVVDCTPNLAINILPVRVLDSNGSGTTLGVGNGVRYAADHGAKVINLSLGGGHSEYLDDSINYAMYKGAVVCVAAGNENENTAYACPAHLSSSIVVAAITENGKRAGFSNYGDSVDVSAPGVGIVSCVPGGGYESLSGTSMATPHISAAAAMLRLDDQNRTPEEIEQLLKNCSMDLGADGWDPYYGAGLPKLSSFVKAEPNGITLYRNGVNIGTDNQTLNVGETMQLTAEVSPAGANQNVTWVSRSPSILEVDDQGLVRTKKQGRGTIQVQAVNGFTTHCYITVVKPGETETLVVPEITSLQADPYLDVIRINWSEYSIPGDEANVELRIKANGKEAFIGNFYDYDELSYDLAYTRHGNLIRAGAVPKVGDTVQIGINTYSWSDGKGFSRSETLWKSIKIEQPTPPTVATLSEDSNNKTLSVGWSDFTECVDPAFACIEIWARANGKEVLISDIYEGSDQYNNRRYQFNYQNISDLISNGIMFDSGDTVDIGVSYFYAGCSSGRTEINWKPITIK